MANKTIHELSSIANLSSSDELAIYDVSGSVTGNGTIEGILGTDITGLDTTASNLIDAVNQHEEVLSQNDLLYADDGQAPTGEVEFVSQDTSLTPSSSTSVTLLSGNDSWSQRFVKISQMFKNIRYLLGKIGSSTMGTTATTVTGAIAEHESDINTLNNRTTIITEDLTSLLTSVSNCTVQSCIAHTMGKLCEIYLQVVPTATLSAGTEYTLGILPSSKNPNNTASIQGSGCTGIIIVNGTIRIRPTINFSTSTTVYVHSIYFTQ